MTEENKKGQDEKAYYSPFPTTLRKLLDRKGETQGKLADYLGVKRQTIGYWKDGKTSPDVDSINKMADYYKVSTDYLLGRSEIESPDIDIPEIHNKIGLSENAIKLLEEVYKDFDRNSFTRAINAVLDHSGVMGLIGQFLFYKLWDKKTKKEVEYIPILYKYPEQKNDGIGWGPEGSETALKGLKVDTKELPDIIRPDMVRELRLFEIQEALRDLYIKLHSEGNNSKQD